MASVALVKRHVWNVLSNAFLSPYVTIKWRCVVRQGVLLCWVIAAFDTHVHIQEARASPLLCCVPIPVLARTSTGRVGLRNVAVREFTRSGEGRQSRFWGVSASGTITRFVLSFLVVSVTIIFFPASRCWSALLAFCTASSGTTTSTGNMSTSASGSAAGYISLMIISIIYMLITFRSHMHKSDVTKHVDYIFLE